MTLEDRLRPSPQKKLLALDGGGIRGLITVEILGRIEDVLRARLGRGSDFVLADYFDYVAGTSTGAIIATCVAMGMSVAEIRRFYEQNGEAMFAKASLLKRFRYRYEDERLAAKLREVLGDRTLGSPDLRTLLLVVMRNATTDSPWPLSSNPAAKYNARTRADCNLDLPLWQLVRASTAAPVYFPPEVVKIGSREFIFVDGGVTTYNNPAFLLFLMATVEAYNLRWPAGDDRLLLVSVGTGTSPNAAAELKASELNLLYNATSIPGALMFAALNEQDMLCRVFGDCRAGDALDREVGDLCGVRGPVDPKLFAYMRYNVELTRDGLDALGLRHVAPEAVQALDSVEHIADLQAVGRAAGMARVDAAHFDGFV